MSPLDGWNYDDAVAAALATKNERERKSLMLDAQALHEFQHAWNRVRLRGLCIHCGAKMSGTPPRCYCLVDD